MAKGRLFGAAAVQEFGATTPEQASSSTAIGGAGSVSWRTTTGITRRLSAPNRTPSLPVLFGEHHEPILRPRDEGRAPLSGV